MSDVAWQRTADHVGSQVDDMLVILDLDGGMYYSLNRPAAEIWELLADATTERNLVASMVEKYKVTPEVCAKSVQNLLNDLCKKGLAKRSD